MPRFWFQLLTLPIATILLLFNARRILFTLAILFAPPRRKPPANAAFRDVLLLVPCRDEAAMMAGLGDALAQLDYPDEHLRIVLIDDGSQDGTRAAMEQLARRDRRVRILGLERNVGKARALNAALARYPFGEIIYVLDADHRPRPDALRALVRYFAPGDVAGVSGRTLPLNGLASPSAYYSAVESYVHQMVTMRAKDRLDLAPALLGSNCAYRRRALEAVGNFRAGAFLEDAELTMRLSLAGYRLRFAEDAVTFYQVPETRAAYLKQHARWGRGFNEIAREYAPLVLRARRLRPALRLELLLFVSGYLDRLAMLGAGGLTLLALLEPFLIRPRGRAAAAFAARCSSESSLSSRPLLLPQVLYLALVMPLVQIAALFVEQRAPRAMWVRLPLVPLFFALDLYAALRAMLDTLLNRRRIWSKTERFPET